MIQVEKTLGTVHKGHPSHNISDFSVVSEKDSTQQEIIMFISHDVVYGT